jgi:hypothetical protein
MIEPATLCDPATLEPGTSPLRLDPASLTRHAVCLGATGSGKTGLCITILESLAAGGTPILAIDPKGDLANLAVVHEQTRSWHERVCVTVLTPGSEAALPVDVLTALTRAPPGLDAEGLREYVVGATRALLGLIGRSADPMTDPAAILLARLLGDAFAAGRPMPLETLIPAVVDPPFDTVGHLSTDTFLPPDERTDLARALNAVVSSPAFAAWRQGVPLDVGAWLTPGERGERTPVTVVYLSHLDDAQRMFFVTLLLHAVVAWSRRLPGSVRLRALVCLDEAMGWLPPYPRDPPSKSPMLTLLKQARAVGVGVMLCTQNPVDLDYKAMSNANTWLVGRLATRQDRARVVDGQPDGPALGQLLARLPPRTFLVRSDRGLDVARSREALTPLSGPLTRRELSLRLSRPPSPPPPLPPGLSARWLDPEGTVWLGLKPGGAYRGLLYGRFRVSFRGLEEPRVVHRAAWPGQPVQALELRDEWLHKVELEPGSYPSTLGGVARDAALATLREAWAADVAAQEVWVDGDKRVFARRYDVEVVGVVWVWVGAHAS